MSLPPAPSPPPPPPSEDWDIEVEDSNIRCNTTQGNRVEFLSHLKKMILADNVSKTIPESTTTGLSLLLTSLRQQSIHLCNETLPKQTFAMALCPFFGYIIPKDLADFLVTIGDEKGRGKVSSLPMPTPENLFLVEVFDTSSTTEERLLRNLNQCLQSHVDDCAIFDESIKGCITTEFMVSAFVSCSLFEIAITTAKKFGDSLSRSQGFSAFSFETTVEVMYKMGRIAITNDIKTRRSAIEIYQQLCSLALSRDNCTDVQCVQVISMAVNIDVALILSDPTNEDGFTNIIYALEMDIAACLESQIHSSALCALLLGLLTTMELLKQSLSPLSGRRVSIISNGMCERKREEGKNHLESTIARHIISHSSPFLQQLLVSIKKRPVIQNRDSNLSLLRKILQTSPRINNSDSMTKATLLEGQNGLFASIMDTERFWKITLSRAAFVLSFIEEDIDKKISALVGNIAICSTCTLRPFAVSESLERTQNHSLLASHIGFASLMRLSMLLEGEREKNSGLATLAIEAACRIICIRDDRLELYAAAAGGINALIPSGLVIRHAHFSAKAFQLERKLCIRFVRCELFEKAIFYHERVLASCLRTGRMREALYVTDALCSLLIDSGDLYKAELYLRSVLRQATLHIAALARSFMFRGRPVDEDILEISATSAVVAVDTDTEAHTNRNSRSLENTLSMPPQHSAQCFARKPRFAQKSRPLPVIIPSWVVWNEKRPLQAPINARTSLANIDEQPQIRSALTKTQPAIEINTLRSFFEVGFPLALTPNSEFYKISILLLRSWLDTEESVENGLELLLNFLPSIPHGAEYDAHKTTSTKAEVSSNRLTLVDLLALESRHQMLTLILNRETSEESLNRLNKSLSRADTITSIDAVWSLAKASFINGEYSDALVAINQVLPFLPVIHSSLTEKSETSHDSSEMSKISRALDSALCVCSNGALVWLRTREATDVLTSLSTTADSKLLFENYLVSVSPNEMAMNMISLHIKVNLCAHRPVEALRSTDLILRAFTKLLTISQSTLLEPMRKLRQLRGRALANIAASPATARLPFSHQHTSTASSVQSSSDRVHSTSNPSVQLPLVSFKTSGELTTAAVSSFSAAFRLCTAPGITISSRRGSLGLTTKRPLIQNDYLALKSALCVAETLLDRRYGRGESDGEGESNGHREIEIPVMVAVQLATRCNEPFCLIRAEIALGELRALQSGLICPMIGQSRTWTKDGIHPAQNQEHDRLEESALQSAKDASELVIRLFSGISGSQGLGKFISSRRVSVQMRNRLEKILNRLALLFLVLGADASAKNWYIFNLLIDTQCNAGSSYRLRPPRLIVSSGGDRDESEPVIFCNDSQTKLPMPLWIKELSLKSAAETAKKSILPMLSPPRLGSSISSGSGSSDGECDREPTTVLKRNTSSNSQQVEHTVSFATSTAEESDDEDEHIREWKVIAMSGKLSRPQGSMIKSNAFEVQVNDEGIEEEIARTEDVGLTGSSIDVILGQLSLIKTACSRMRTTSDDTTRSIGLNACHLIQSSGRRFPKTSESKDILFKSGVSFTELLSSASIDPSSTERLKGLVFVISLAHEINVLYSPANRIAHVLRGPLTTSLSDRQFFARMIDVPVRVSDKHNLPSFLELGNISLSNFANSLLAANGPSRVFLTVSPSLSLWPFENFFNEASRIAVGDCIVQREERDYARIGVSVLVPKGSDMGEEIDLLRRRSLLSAHLRKLDSTLRRPPYPTGTATTSLLVKNLLRYSTDTHDIEIISQEGAALIAKLCNVPNFTSDIVSSLEAMNSRTGSFIIPDDWTIRSKLTNEFFSRRHLIEASANVNYVSTQEILLQSEDTTFSSILLLSFADAMLGLSHRVPLSVSAILFISNSAVNLTIHYMNDKTLNKTMTAQKFAQCVAVKLRKEGHLVIVQLSS